MPNNLNIQLVSDILKERCSQNAFVTSQIDYFDSLLHRVSATHVQPLTECTHYYSTNHTAQATVPPHYHWLSGSTALAVCLAENRVQGVRAGLQVASPGNTNLSRQKVNVASISDLCSVAHDTTTLWYLAAERQGMDKEVSLFLFLHYGIHYCKQFKTHCWHWLSSVCTCWLCYSAELMEPHNSAPPWQLRL